METLSENRQHEGLQSFDVLASVRALKLDLERFGFVLPETRQQVCDQELSYITEGIDRSAQTTFVFKREGDDLVYFDDGDWRSYGEMLAAGHAAALHDAAIDPRRQFLVDWAVNDIYQHQQNKQLKPGDKRVWASPYPYDMELRYGREFMSGCGLAPSRKLGYLYQASCNDDGSIVLRSQTIDRSDDEAFAATLSAAKLSPELDLNELTVIYDQSLAQKYGGEFQAGRRPGEAVSNAWDAVQANYDLIHYLIEGLISLAAKNIEPKQLELDTKRHIYGVWALISKRLEGLAEPLPITSGSSGYLVNHIWLREQVEDAFSEFVTSGKALIGCGGSISYLNGEDSALSANKEDVFTAIFSSKTRTETMKCVHCPLCNRQGVNATIVYKEGKKTITCSRCKRSKTY